MTPSHPPISGASSRRLGFLLAAGAAVLFSAKAILAKFQFRYGLDALDVMALRMGLALPLFALLAVRESRRAAAPLQARDRALILVLGVLGYYLSSLLDFWGLQYVPVSLERLILFLNPTFVLLLGVVLFKRRVARREWVALAVSYAGVALVFVESLRLEGDHLALGGALVLGAALAYALYLALSGELIHRVGPLRLVAYAMLVSTAVTAIHYVIARDPAGLLRLSAPVYGLALVNAVLCTFAPVTMTMAAVARIGSGAAAQLSALGPVSLLFLRGWLLGESVSALQVLGTAVVLCGVLLLARPAANSVPLDPIDDPLPGQAGNPPGR
ncbi:DMT family transporter [Agrilutibacter solisilvae]|uniref:DMT family transporter n=1 Tax=Agrilutibacter solisilvae TaxID=2763317 RepID=A0A974Y390_9GAMM|nr:DMT family transporter [Lysobacter solisilvae]QSX76966.1 DMT family transporter [Lysobacter solisilvae]